ncbi:hypothetical protein OHA37_26910 [Streptomyces sp. NBC_00335]|uniref:hypothetical protein n=1 Tax=unclassified Streptomyces TaxID=2593676 RepID=UPI00224F4780|nr:MULTISPECIES: hypothetical protein [unclassified Streptomyces]MCX5407481.1 hypothetical protein [Streptomyces sp. NBC_00086]
MNESTNCICCTRELWEDELGRFACRPCERRIGDQLAAIAGPYGLYARLCLRMEPGAHTGGEIVSGSSSPSIPANLQILDLTAAGGIVGTLESWVEEWSSQGLATRGTGGRLQHRIDQAVATLRLNLPRAVERHPALDEFAREIDGIQRTAKALVDGGREPVKASAVCLGCGGGFKFGLFDIGGTDCNRCGHHHTRAQLLQPEQANASAA